MVFSTARVILYAFLTWFFFCQLKWREKQLFFSCESINYELSITGIHSFSSVQSLSCVWLFATPGIAARQASLFITNSWSLLKLMSIESVKTVQKFHCLVVLLNSCPLRVMSLILCFVFPQHVLLCSQAHLTMQTSPQGPPSPSGD